MVYAVNQGPNNTCPECPVQKHDVQARYSDATYQSICQHCKDLEYRISEFLAKADCEVEEYDPVDEDKWVLYEEYPNYQQYLWSVDEPDNPYYEPISFWQWFFRMR